MTARVVRIQRHGSRGGGLIPDSAFEPRQGSRPTTERTHAPEGPERDRTRLTPGSYHKRPVRYDAPEGEDE